MKRYSTIFSCVGFIFQYIIPIVLFGNVIPYTHGSLKAGLTAMGYIAVAVLVVIISGKIKGKLHDMPKGLARAGLLSIFPIAYWLIVKIGINYILNLFASLGRYWGYVIIFIVIGRLFCILSEVLYKEENKDG